MMNDVTSQGGYSGGGGGGESSSHAGSASSHPSFGGSSAWAAHSAPPDPYGPPPPPSSKNDDPILDDDGYYHDAHGHARGEHNSHQLSHDSMVTSAVEDGDDLNPLDLNPLDLEESSDGRSGRSGGGLSAGGTGGLVTVGLGSPPGSGPNSRRNSGSSDRDEWKRAAAGTFTTFRLSQEDVFVPVVEGGVATVQRRGEVGHYQAGQGGRIPKRHHGKQGGGGQRGGGQPRRGSLERRDLVPKNLRSPFGRRDSLGDYFRDEEDSVSIWGDVRRQLGCCDGMGKFQKACLAVIAAAAGMCALVGGTLPGRSGGGGGGGGGAVSSSAATAAAGPLRPNAAVIRGAVGPSLADLSDSSKVGSYSSSSSSAADAAVQQSLASYADVYEPWNPDVEVPVFWHLPRAGGTTATGVLGKCLGMVGAGRFGEEAPNGEASTLQVDTNGDGIKYVNVDTTTPEGVQRAQDLGLIHSGLADYLVASDVHVASPLFDPSSSTSERRGRIFALLRHPVKGAVSAYFHRAKTDPRVAALSLSDYAGSDLSGEDNPLVRSLLLLTPEALVSTRHVADAKSALSSKVLVGITEFMDESLVRFEQYLRRWDDLRGDVDGLRCQQDTVLGGDVRASAHAHYDPGTEEFQKLSLRHWADVEVYHYAKQLFREQAGLVGDGATADAAGRQ